MRFRLLEAPSALGAASRKNPAPARTALGAGSRSNKVASATNKQSQASPTVPSTPDEWEAILYNDGVDRGFREIACVKWLENNRPSSSLLSILGELRNRLKAFDASVSQSQDKIDSDDKSTTFVDTNDGEEKQDKIRRATDKAVAQRELDNLIKQTEKVRNKVKVIFNAIFEAIDCKSDVFENIISRLNLKDLPQPLYINLVSLVRVVAADKEFDTEKKYLLDLSLYNRQPKDFEYTIRVFNVVHNKSLLAKYYDPERVTVEDLYDGNGIKPAGIDTKDPDDFGTIYGVLETWKESAPNENTSKPVKSDAKKSRYEYSSFEDAEEEHMNQDGSVIKINGKFKFNGKTKKWEPIKK